LKQEYRRRLRLLAILMVVVVATVVLAKQLLSQKLLATACQVGRRVKTLPVWRPVNLQQQQQLTELLCKLSWQRRVLHLHLSATLRVHWKASYRAYLQQHSRHSMMLLQLWQQQWQHLPVAAAAMHHHQGTVMQGLLLVVLLLLVHCSRLVAGVAAGAALLLLGVLIMTVCRRRLLQQRLLRSRKLQHVLLWQLLPVGSNCSSCTMCRWQAILPYRGCGGSRV
jgi:hypothetical protein